MWFAEIDVGGDRHVIVVVDENSAFGITRFAVQKRASDDACDRVTGR
jgi:hypothetical protein